MQNTSYIAVSRQTALMRQMDTVANNIANANTPAFKGEHMLFAEYLEKAPGGGEMSYVQDLSTVRDSRQGALKTTGSALDIAIHGEGYFVAQTPAGDRYTRNGHFELDADRRIVTSHGYPVMGEGDQELVLPPEAIDVTITADGIVTADGQLIGEIRVVLFEDDGALKKTMSGLYATDEEALPAVDARVMQAMSESSNVEPLVEMTRMIELNRAFQGIQNMIDGEHDRMTRAIRELPRAEA